MASSNRIDDDGLRRLAETAGAIARNSEELEDWGGLPEPTPVTEIPAAFADATAAATPELRAEGVRAVIAAADAAGVISYGSFATDAEVIAVANSKGIRASQQRTTSQLLTVAMAPDGGSGYAESAAVDVSDIDAAAIGREAADKARVSANPVSVEPGDWAVVLEEYAVVDLLAMLGYMGFSALAVQEERSFAEPGKKVGSDLVTIVDDGMDPADAADGLRLRGRRQATGVAHRARHLPRCRLRRPDRSARRADLDRPRAARPEPVRAVPVEHGHERRRRRLART